MAEINEDLNRDETYIRMVETTKEHYGGILARNLKCSSNVADDDQNNNTIGGIQSNAFYCSSFSPSQQQHLNNENNNVNNHCKNKNNINDENDKSYENEQVLLMKQLIEENMKLKRENKKLNDCLDFIQKVAGYQSRFFSNLVWYSRQSQTVTNETVDTTTTTTINGRNSNSNLDNDDAATNSNWKQEFLQNCIQEYGMSFLDKLNHLHNNSNQAQKWFVEGFHAGCLASSRLFVILTNIRNDRITSNRNGGNITWKETIEQQRIEALDAFPMLDT